MAIDRVKLKALAIEFAACLPPPDPSRRRRPSPAAFVEGDFSDSVAVLPVVDDSPRAVATRKISAIVARTGWTLAVTSFLDMHGVCSVHDLGEEQVYDLLRCLNRHVENAEIGCYAQDDFPAR